MQHFKLHMMLFLLMVIYGCSSVIVNQDYPLNTDQTQSGFVFGMGSFGYHGGLGFSTGNSAGSRDDNMLVIDIIDSGSDGIIWRGTGTRSLVQHADPEKITKEVNKTVTKILMQFPPQEK